ncbi:Spy/CpxP family protein refolding chaperone [Carboxylicivirga caseinilyticus]|uniref:Spy/CpxP family protein refolding chaperone n=1 Tax=Carboxylicivirga caseinilyticus TaxID=3417572 RepID=UPI003D3436C6|nr:DUF4890 domain-containing protein [Marinilabiliaceae bacterium A049]
MKKLILGAFLTIFIASASQAQNRPSPEERVKQQTEQMAKDLNLTEKQKEQVTELNKKFGEKMKKMRDENQGNREKMREAMGELRTERNTELKKILTDEQYKKYLELEEKRMKERGNRGPGGDRPNR